MKWGLETSVPLNNAFSTFNCRSESLVKPTGLWVPFRNSKRCLVFAEGYYEWHKTGSTKTPYYVKRRDGQLLCMAGLWNNPTREGNKWYTFTIVTAAASEDLRWLHDRMPVMICTEASMKRWIDPKLKWTSQLLTGLDMLKTKDELEWYEVSPEVGKVKNNYASLNKKVEKKSIQQFFSPAKAKIGEKRALETETEAPPPKKQTDPEPKKLPTSPAKKIKTTGNAKITSFFKPK